MPDRDLVTAKEMKRKGNLYGQIISLENLRLADTLARKGKTGRKDIREHDKNREANILALHTSLGDKTYKTYKTSPYHIFSVYEPKERLVYQLTNYMDRIVHYAILIIIEPIFMAVFTTDTYSCIKGRGIHGAHYAVLRALRDEAGTRFYLKMDVRKFYPSVDHSVLKNLLRRKFKDSDLLWLLDGIIDSAPGLPIGNYMSQFFANFMLTGLDHWIKEKKCVRRYFRYMDDMVVFAPDKPSLHELRASIQIYLRVRLRLELKKNYRIAPVSVQGVDFVGYLYFHWYTLLRKSIKKNFARKMAKRPSLSSFASYYGWAAHCNSNNLLKTLLIKANEKLQRNGNHSDFPSLRRRQRKNRAPIE